MYLRREDRDGFHRGTEGEFFPKPVANHPAVGTNLDNSLMLIPGLLDEAISLVNLQIPETYEHQEEPSNSG